MVLDNLPGGALNSIEMLPTEHNDPINEKILAISEDKIEGFVREPFEQIARRSGLNLDVVMTHHLFLRGLSPM